MTAVCVGRFQVPELHAGHIHLLKTASEKSDKLVVILGIAPEVSTRNPYSVPHRVKIILDKFPHAEFRGIEDIPGQDEQWSKNIDDIVSRYEDPVFFVGRDSFSSHYKGEHKIREIESLPGYSGTDMRAKLNQSK